MSTVDADTVTELAQVAVLDHSLVGTPRPRLIMPKCGQLSYARAKGKEETLGALGLAYLDIYLESLCWSEKLPDVKRNWVDTRAWGCWPHSKQSNCQLGLF
jgi:hypothetical protein